MFLTRLGVTAKPPTSRLRALAALLALLFASCNRAAQKPAAPPAVPIVAAVVEKRDVPLEAAAVGHVDPYATVAIRSRVGGPVVRGPL